MSLTRVCAFFSHHCAPYAFEIRVGHRIDLLTMRSRPLLAPQLLVPFDLPGGQGTYRVVIQASIALPLPVPGRIVKQHLVLHVKPPQLIGDPGQTVCCLCSFRNVPTSCCNFDLKPQASQLVMEALAEYFEVRERADLKRQTN